jgi:hypothetical protein
MVAAPRRHAQDGPHALWRTVAADQADRLRPGHPGVGVTPPAVSHSPAPGDRADAATRPLGLAVFVEPGGNNQPRRVAVGVLEDVGQQSALLGRGPDIESQGRVGRSEAVGAQFFGGGQPGGDGIHHRPTPERKKTWCAGADAMNWVPRRPPGPGKGQLPSRISAPQSSRQTAGAVSLAYSGLLVGVE